MMRNHTAHVVTPESTVPNRTTIYVVASIVMCTAVSTIVGNPYRRAAVVEVATIVITIDREVPTACTPNDRTQEVVGCYKEIVLPVVKYAAKVAHTIAVVAAVKVGRRINPQEVIEVDLVCIVILLVVEIELIGHLVRQVKSLCLSTLETHCADTHPGCHHHQGKN